jgi:hypothetical protein
VGKFGKRRSSRQPCSHGRGSLAFAARTWPRPAATFCSMAIWVGYKLTYVCGPAWVECVRLSTSNVNSQPHHELHAQPSSTALYSELLYINSIRTTRNCPTRLSEQHRVSRLPAGQAWQMDPQDVERFCGEWRPKYLQVNTSRLPIDHMV